MRYFTFDHGMRMYNAGFEEVMGQPTRPLTKGDDPFHKDVARSLQEVVNEVMVKLATASWRTRGRPACAWRAAWPSTAWRTATSCANSRRDLRAAGAGDAGGAMGLPSGRGMTSSTSPASGR